MIVASKCHHLNMSLSAISASTSILVSYFITPFPFKPFLATEPAELPRLPSTALAVEKIAIAAEPRVTATLDHVQAAARSLQARADQQRDTIPEAGSAINNALCSIWG
jgi:hypothetical protein